ncbi:hypothetical protein DC1_00032 [Burkholderia phage DC1]|uniref:Uncharacterized protein n=1 Tax=Burkholderia phage DC1 TaxID=2881398 RepID=I6NVM7_9CAUD|nr:hypothetical protein B862_gp51 [Burkholderia phage DC1]AEZ50850.1 hypothetical protein DC1_00032 [Burkholderia phage DC1]
MDTTKTGGPAFPIADPFALRPRDETELERIASGMSLRDYFAAKALAGWIASTEPQRNPVEVADRIAAGCYALADAMLRAREA